MGRRVGMFVFEQYVKEGFVAGVRGRERKGVH